MASTTVHGKNRNRGWGMEAEQSTAGLASETPRWGQVGADLSRLLMRRPRASDVCRYLVLSVPWPDPPSGSVMLRCQDDAHLEVLGWFGYPQEVVGAYQRLSLFDELPLTTAARTRASVALYAGLDVQETYPSLAEEFADHTGPPMGALLAVPLLSDLGAVGVLGMSFHDRVDPAGPTLTALESLAPLLGLYVELGSPPVTLPETGLSSAAIPIADFDAGDPTPGSEGLTKRQLRILRMLSKKMSNRDIALALDYSVSTIRLDTMAIFRFLGVKSRREAVEEARRRGIVTT